MLATQETSTCNSLQVKACLICQIVKSSGKKLDKFTSDISQALLKLEKIPDFKMRKISPGSRKFKLLLVRKHIIFFFTSFSTEIFTNTQTWIIVNWGDILPGCTFSLFRGIFLLDNQKKFTKSAQKYHRYSSLTAVHIILENLVFASEIVHKRILINWMAPIHHHLHKAKQNTTDHKVKSFYGVCKKLMGKCVNFEFSEVQF